MRRLLLLALPLLVIASVLIVLAGPADAACVESPCGSIAATLNWGTIPGASGYDVYVNGVQKATSAAAMFTFTGLACDTTYQLGVSAAGSGTILSEPYTTAACSTGGGTIFPLALSSNDRFLQTASGAPFLMVGDSPQDIVGNLSVTNADAYMDDREREGFNTVWDNLLCDDYTACAANGKAVGDGGGSIAPFTSGTAPSSYAVAGSSSPPYCGDCNSSYFSRAHSIYAHAEADGIEVFLDPAETGGWLPFTEANGNGTISTTDNDYRYGEYLGTEFGDLPNIVWLMGNDFQNISTNPDMDDLKTLLDGILATDPTALYTVETDFDSTFSTSTSLTDVHGFDTTWGSFTKLDSVYTYSPAFDGIAEANAEAPTMPSLLVESNYEAQKNGTYDGCITVRNCRLQEWWTMTSGAAGQFYGGNYGASTGNPDEGSFGILNGFTDGDIDTTAAQQLGYETTLLDTLPWQTFKPDTGHLVVTAGVGTCDASPHSIVAETCVTTASDYAGSGTGSATTSVSYLPDPSSFSSVTVNLADFAGPVTAKWYDPTDGVLGSAISGSPFTNSGTHSFAQTSNNNAGDKDWVLLLQG